MDQSHRANSDIVVSAGPHTASSPTGNLLLTIPQEDAVVAAVNALGRDARLVTVTAESGAGKTLVANCIADRLQDVGMTVVQVRPQPQPTRAALLAEIAPLLEIEPGLLARTPDHAAARLVASATPVLPIVFILDDAESWPVNALETLALLTGARPSSSSLHAVLLGAAHLRSQMQASAPDQLFLSIPPLTLRQAREYIARRFAVHGGIRRKMSALAVDEVLLRAGGNPRRIDRLTDDCLSLTGGRRRRYVTPTTVHVAFDAASSTSPGRLRRAIPVLLAGSVGSALAVTGLLLGFGGQERPNGQVPGSTPIGASPSMAIPAGPDVFPAMRQAIPAGSRDQHAEAMRGVDPAFPILTPPDANRTVIETPRADPKYRNLKSSGTIVASPTVEGLGHDSPAAPLVLMQPPPMPTIPVAPAAPAGAAAVIMAPVPRTIATPIEIALLDLTPGRLMATTQPVPVIQALAAPETQAMTALGASPDTSSDNMPIPLPPPAIRTFGRPDRSYNGPLAMHRTRGGETLTQLLMRVYGHADLPAQITFRALNPGLDGPGPWPRGIVVAMPGSVRHPTALPPKALAPGPDQADRDETPSDTKSSVPYFCRSISPQNGAEDAYTRQVCGR